jgi:phosphoribosylformylglycinamidine synthase
LGTFSKGEGQKLYTELNFTLPLWGRCPKGADEVPSLQQTRTYKMKAKIKVTLKAGVLDPQGKAIEGALGSLGFVGVNGVRQGKYFEIDVEETNQAKAEAAIKSMCEKLIANTVIENYEIELIN